MKPTLIHPVIISFCNPDLTKSVNKVWEDVEFSNNKNEIDYLASAKIKGQVKYYKFDSLYESKNGFQPLGDGYLTVYPVDSEKILKGAKIINIAGKDVVYYVKEKKPCAHYEGEAQLVKIFFESKVKG